MKSHTKIISGIAIASAMTLGATTPYQNELTLAELMTLPQIYNYEAQQIGEIKLDGVKNENEILAKVNDIIEKRVVTQDEKVTINGQELTGEQYTELRDTLLPKVEAKSLLERITE